MQCNDLMKWPEAYERLKVFIEGEPKIKVSRLSLSVPQEFRLEFYQILDVAQKSLACEVLGDYVAYAEKTAADTASVLNEIKEQANLKTFKLAVALEGLLKDPLAALSRPGFSLVLNGLQNNCKADEVLHEAMTVLPVHAKSLARNAYEAWAYYGIVAALEPVRFWSVYSPDSVELYAVETDEVAVGFQLASHERRMPEAVFETSDGRVFAIKSEAARELDYYGVKIKLSRDTSAGGNTAGLICHRVLMMYSLASPEEVTTILDRQKRKQVLCDLMCEVLEPEDIETPARMSPFVERINALRPRRPVQILTQTEEGLFPVGMQKDKNVAPFERRVIGCDRSRLADVAALLNE